MHLGLIGIIVSFMRNSTEPYSLLKGFDHILLERNPIALEYLLAGFYFTEILLTSENSIGLLLDLKKSPTTLRMPTESQ